MGLPKVFSNSVIYTGVTVLQQCMAFFLLPLYTAYLTPADYGITGVVGSVSSLLAIFVSLGVSAAGSRFYYKYKGDPVYARKLYGTIICAILVTTLFFGTLFIAAHKWIVDPIVGEIDFYPNVLLGLLNVLVTPLYSLYQSYLQTIQKGIKFGINAILYFLLDIGLTIALVVYWKMGATGVLTAHLVTSVVFFIHTFFSFVRHQKLGFEKGILKEIYKYSLPLLPHSLANWSNGTIDKLLVNDIRSTEDAGLYNLGRQYTGVTNTISVAINNAYVPWFYDKANDIKNNLASIRRMSEMITYAVCFISIVMSLLAKEVLDLMISNPAYDGVWKVVPFLICGVIFNSIYFFYVNVLFLKDTSMIFTITISTIFINVGLNVWLIPIFGYIGCGLASLFTFLIKSLIGVFVSMHKNKEIRFNTLYLYTIAIISSLLCISALCFDNLSLFFSLGLKLLIIIACGLFVLLKYRNEITGIVNTLKAIINNK